MLSGLSRLGPNHKSTVERANFAVLRHVRYAGDAVETAFISNPDEEQRLTDTDAAGGHRARRVRWQSTAIS